MVVPVMRSADSASSRSRHPHETAAVSTGRNSPHLAIVGAMMVAILAGAASAQQPAPSLPPGTAPPRTQPPTTPPAATPPPASTGAPKAEARELDKLLSESQQAFAARRFADSGGLLFKAAAQAEAMGDPTAPELSHALAYLRVLAFDTASHTVADATAFNRAAAATHHALAAESARGANGAWAERRAVQTGRRLEIGAYHLRRSIEWGGQAVNPEGEKTLQQAVAVGAALQRTDTPPPPPGQVTEALGRYSQMTAAVGSRLAQYREEPGFDQRVGDAAQRAVRGIQTGTRKAAEAVGSGLERFGRWLRGE